jgi:uncharacterized membrane protein
LEQRSRWLARDNRRAVLTLYPSHGIEGARLFLTAPELAEDPTDRIATLLQRMVQELGADTKLFASGYLIVHGIIKVVLVVALLRRRLWSYPVSLWFLAAFIAYQVYRFYFTRSFWMIALTIVDLIVVFLIWREYQARKTRFA